MYQWHFVFENKNEKKTKNNKNTKGMKKKMLDFR